LRWTDEKRKGIWWTLFHIDCNIILVFSLLVWGETESTWHVCHYSALGVCILLRVWDHVMGPIVAASNDRRWCVLSNPWKEIWQGKPKYSEKSCPSDSCPPQIPLNLTWARTRAAAAGSQRLTV
jgi:hypothetical protein